MIIALLLDHVGAPTYTGKPVDPAWRRRVKSPWFRFSAFRFRLHGSRLSMRFDSPACGGCWHTRLFKASKPHEAGDKTSCNFFFRIPIHLFELLTVTNKLHPLYVHHSLCTMQSKWIIRRDVSLDHIGLGTHLVVKWLVSRYNLIHEDLLLIMQISTNQVPGYRVVTVFVTQAQGTAFFIGELFAPFQNSHNRSIPNWSGLLGRRVGLKSHSVFPFNSTYPEISQNGSTSILFQIQRFGSYV